MRAAEASSLAPPVPESVIGVGVDIIEIARARQATERGGERLIHRLFSTGEQRYCSRRRFPERHYAARFAAKESVIKALRVPPDPGWLWGEIEVASQGGPPSLRLTGRALDRSNASGVSNLHLSLSHSETHAMALVVLT